MPKDGKSCESGELTIPNQSQCHFGGKDRKICKNGRLTHLSHFLAKFAVVGHFQAVLV